MLNMYCLIILALSTAVLTATAGGDFHPTLSTSCSSGTLTVHIQTPAAFSGVAYTQHRRRRCFAAGRGQNSTNLIVPLTDGERCNIVYNRELEEYFVLVHVRQHPVIILDQDKTFNVSCRKAAAHAERAPEIRLGLYENRNKIFNPVFGRPYTISVTVSEGRPFRVGACAAYAGATHTLQLTDPRGCGMWDGVAGTFVQSPDGRWASAELPSMFRFPKGRRTVHLECDVQLCHDAAGCAPADCSGGGRRQRTARGDIAVEEEWLPPPRPPLSLALVDSRRVVHGRHFASTTVRVLDFGNVTEVTLQSDCNVQYRLTSTLCAVFGALFLAGVVVNGAFCYYSGCTMNWPGEGKRRALRQRQVMIAPFSTDGSSGMGHTLSPSSNTAVSSTQGAATACGDGRTAAGDDSQGYPMDGPSSGSSERRRHQIDAAFPLSSPSSQGTGLSPRSHNHAKKSRRQRGSPVYSESKNVLSPNSGHSAAAFSPSTQNSVAESDKSLHQRNKQRKDGKLDSFSQRYDQMGSKLTAYDMF